MYEMVWNEANHIIFIITCLLQVMMGQGIDRHFLGLKLTAIEHGMNVPDLLMDPVYTSTCYYQLSTSQVNSTLQKDNLQF